MLSGIAVFLLLAQSMLDVLRQKFVLKKAIFFEGECSRSIYDYLNRAPVEANRYIFNDINELRALLASPSFFVMFDLPWTPIFIAVMFVLHPVIGLMGW
ncbi:type I secretion system ATPase [Vibrio astriarenae]|nr:type I secretion system ATPase [Vibrio sp. C7]